MRIIFSCGHSGSGAGTSARTTNGRAGPVVVEAHDAHRRLRRAIEVGDERQDRAEQDRHLDADRDRRDEGGGGDREVLAAEAPQRCQPARSNSDHEISSSSAAIAGSGISASSGALTGDQQQQPERSEHRRQRRARAGLEVGHRAVERAARHVRREEAADDVRQALAAELAVGIDVLARALGDRLGDRDRLAERDDGERERDADQVGQRAQVDVGQREARPDRRDRADDRDRARAGAEPPAVEREASAVRGDAGRAA